MYLFRAMQISAKGCADACIHTHSLALIYMARAIHEQKESLEEAILRMGSEQIAVARYAHTVCDCGSTKCGAIDLFMICYQKGKDKLCLKDKSVW